jgi:hypothetical protein
VAGCAAFALLALPLLAAAALLLVALLGHGP